MSILLEALKKSEAQRQLGTTPTLQTPVESATGSGNRNWIPIFMLASAAAAMSWIGWEQFRQPEMIVNPVAAGRPAAEEPGEGQDVVAAPSGDAPASAEHSDATAPSVASRPARTGSKRASLDDTRQQLAKSVKSYASDHPVPSPKKGKASTSAALTHKKMAADLPQPTASRLPESSPVAEGAHGLETDSISFWQMPSSLRESMPELRMTVLVYAERPEDRFLLINGQRLREHEELESGVVLEEIQRSRAIFSYRNYRFHLKS